MSEQTKQIDEGGPAYPQPNHIVDHDAHGRVEARQWLQDSGMTRRQWLAGMAMQVLLADSNNMSSASQIAEGAYEVADAMLAAEKGGK